MNRQQEKIPHLSMSFRKESYNLLINTVMAIARISN